MNRGAWWPVWTFFAALMCTAVDSLGQDLCRRCGIPSGLSAFGVRDSDVPGMAESAMTITRLLKNNPREVTRQDAERIYRGLLK